MTFPSRRDCINPSVPRAEIARSPQDLAPRLRKPAKSAGLRNLGARGGGFCGVGARGGGLGSVGARGKRGEGVAP